ncbi:MAG: S-adenosyl-l-methionine hydroxide adenosyltransferase family protein [Candidatus Njordarchaeota archaeon]
MSNIICLLTDFGYSDPFVGIMRGVILGINPKAKILDLAHGIPKFDVRHAAFILRIAYKYFPEGTVFCVVVDPGVGTERRSIVIKTRNYFFVGPDNGCLMWAAEDNGIIDIVEIANKRYMLKEISTTFHGRDIFAPIAAHISKGLDLGDIGPKLSVEALAKIKLREPIISEDMYVAEVITADGFGNIFLHMKSELLEEQIGEKLIIQFGDKKVEAEIAQTYGDVPEGKFLILKESSHGFLEIAMNRGSATRILGVSPGETIKILRGKLDNT